MLDIGGPLITLAAKEVRAELTPDGLAIIDTGQLDSVGDLGPGDATSGVVHDDDLELAPHKQLKRSLHIGDSAVLPGLSDQLRRNAFESGNDEAILERLVLATVGKLSICSELKLDNTVQAPVILLQ